MKKEELEKIQAQYKLTEEEYQEYFNNVKLFFTAGSYSVDVPALIILAGQPGAGKSKLIPVLYEQLGYNAVILDYDKLRSLHPKFEEANKGDFNVHLALLPDADRANEELRKYCKEKKINMIYEGTMRATAGFINMAQEYKDSGYEVNLALMAVPRLESYGSTIVRYAADVFQNNTPRWVPKEVHDEAYENLITTLKEYEKKGIYNKAEVYRRGKNDENGQPVRIYSTAGREFHNPIEAVEFGRQNYKINAVMDFPTKFSTVKHILEEGAPEMVDSLQDWENLYYKEKDLFERNKLEKQSEEL